MQQRQYQLVQQRKAKKYENIYFLEEKWIQLIVLIDLILLQITIWLRKNETKVEIFFLISRIQKIK